MPCMTMYTVVMYDQYVNMQVFVTVEGNTVSIQGHVSECACCMQMISTMYNNIHSEADKDNAKWNINDISRGYT